MKRSCFLVPIAAFAMFWIFRPYGLFGGDSEIVERSIHGGAWFWQREPLTTAFLQSFNSGLSPLGWTTDDAISLASCLAGAVGALALWKISQSFPRPHLGFAMLFCTGSTLNFYGSIEVYAPATACLCWILYAVQQDRPKAALGLFALLGWLHPIAFFLSPAAGFYAFQNRNRIESYWACIPLALSVPFVGYILGWREGIGFENPLAEVATTSPTGVDLGPPWALKHLAVKAEFLWVATGLSLPLAAIAVYRVRDRTIRAWTGVAASLLGFFVVFHPDLGRADWDLFLFPSIPVAVIAAAWVTRSRHAVAIAVVWIAAFLSIWAPTVPIWARFDERGTATVIVENWPADAKVRLNDRYRVRDKTFKVKGGFHSLSIERSGDLHRWRTFQANPGDTIRLRLPEERVAGPFATMVADLSE